MSFQHHFAPYITDRELQVALLVFAGKASKEIAIIMGVEPCTVESYRKAIRNRFHVRNFLELRAKFPYIVHLKPGKGRQYL